MKPLLAFVLIFSGFAFGQGSNIPNVNTPGGSSNTGNCAQWTGPNTLGAAGAACGSAISFPILAPSGTLTAPSYSFTSSVNTNGAAGIGWSSGSGLQFSDSSIGGTGFLFKILQPDGSLEFQLGCTYSSLGCGGAVIPSGITSANVVQRWHQMVTAPSGVWNGALQYQHEASTPSVAFVVTATGNPVTFIFPCTGIGNSSCSNNQGPVEFGDETAQGAHATWLSHSAQTQTLGQLSLSNVFQISNQNNTGSNTGNVNINGIFTVDNSSSNSGTGAVNIQVPVTAGSVGGQFRLFTNDGAFGTGATGSMLLAPNASTGRANVSYYNDNGIDIQQINHSGTTQTSMRMSNGAGIQVGFGGFGTFQWSVPDISGNITDAGSHNITAGGKVSGATYATATNCASSGGTCSSAAAGRVSIAASATTVTVATTAVTASSEIFIQEDSTLGTALSVTCNTTTGRTYTVTTRTGGTSFVITSSAAPSTNPACLSYHIVN